MRLGCVHGTNQCPSPIVTQRKRTIIRDHQKIALTPEMTLIRACLIALKYL